MTSATVDRSELRHVLFSGTIVGAVTAAAVIVYLAVSRLLSPGLITALLQTVIVLAGAVAATFLPAFFASARTVQGIASAAAIGLWGTIVFMAIDIVLLRPLNHLVGTYPWTWDAIGGGSTWWYLPIWWMLGTFVAWMGGVVTAGRAARGGDPSIRSLAIPAVAGGAGLGLGLGLSGLVYMPVAGGAGFVLTVIVFALVVLGRRG